MYDVIVVGARAAGAPTAMLLARKGYKVLLVDRAHFPSDSPLANLIQLKGCAALKRWGLLERVLASNCPPVSRATLQIAQYSLQGEYQSLDGIEATICPRRPTLDQILVDAAAEAGAEIRDDLLVEDMLTDKGRGTGVRGRLKSIQRSREIKVEEKATLVVGADGKHSLIARSTQAQEYQVRPVLACVYYTYWEGFGPTNGELYYLTREAIGLWPTNSGLINIFAAYPVSEFQAVRGNIEARFWKTVENIPGMTERLRNGRRVERFYGTADLPAFYRRPYGPGWALVGDAGMTLDPFTG
jgi:flavin-dependent dehydrogenase